MMEESDRKFYEDSIKKYCDTLYETTDIIRSCSCPAEFKRLHCEREKIIINIYINSMILNGYKMVNNTWVKGE